MSGDGFLSITGRKKDLIITSSGKNVTPVNIESALRESRYITEAVVYGDNRSYLVAMVTLDRDEARKLAKRLDIPFDGATLAADARVHEELQREIDGLVVTPTMLRVSMRFCRFAVCRRSRDRSSSHTDTPAALSAARFWFCVIKAPS